MKKILTVLVLVLTLSVSTTAFASLTFTTNAITGTTASTIDLGSVNDLFLQTTGRNVAIGTATTLGSKLSIDASGSNTTPLIIKTNGSPGNYTPANSGIFIKDAAGVEMLRIVGSDPDNYNDYNAANLYIGQEAGFNQPTDNSTAGFYNTGIGTRALYHNTTGFGNTAFGGTSLYNVTTGNINTSIGYTALNSNVTGSGNVAIGFLAGAYETGSNTFYVNNSDQSNTAGDKAYSLLYGKFAGSAGTTVGNVLTVNGNLGISTTAPSQKLEVNGGIRLNTATVKPTCDATIRGTLWTVQNGAGVADSAEICRKDAADAYVWTTIY